LNADMNRTKTMTVGCVRNPVVTGNDPRKLQLDSTRDNLLKPEAHLATRINRTEPV
jgi:hypothetical protein